MLLNGTPRAHIPAAWAAICWYTGVVGGSLSSTSNGSSEMVRNLCVRVQNTPKPNFFNNLRDYRQQKFRTEDSPDRQTEIAPRPLRAERAARLVRGGALPATRVKRLEVRVSEARNTWTKRLPVVTRQDPDGQPHTGAEVRYHDPREIPIKRRRATTWRPRNPASSSRTGTTIEGNEKWNGSKLTDQRDGQEN